MNQISDGRARRVVLLGLDAVSWDLLDVLAPEMPVLSRLRAEGASATLMSTVPPITPVAWTSLVTGVSPGRHGVYEFVHRTPSGEWRPVSRRQCRAPAIDQFLERAGRRSILINLPLSYPGRTKAIRLEDFLSGNPEPVDPPALKDRAPELAAYRAFYAPGAIGAQSLDAVAADVIDLEERRFAAARYLMTHEPWDFVFYGVTGTDHLNHRALSRILDGGDPPQGVVRLYRLVDRVAGWLVDQMGPSDLLVVASDHGSAVHRREFFLNAWLERRGQLRWTATAAGAGGSRWKAALRRLAVRTGADIVTRPLRKRLGMAGGGGPPKVDVDEAHSAAYMPRRYAWPAVIAPGADLTKLAAALREVRDPQTGAAAFDSVQTAAEAYPGERQSGAPDLLLMPRTGVTVHSGRSRELWRDIVKNHHKPEGILLLFGQAARSLPRALEPARVEDVCPTVLAALGVPAPYGIDGRSLLPAPRRGIAERAVRDALMAIRKEPGSARLTK